MIKIIFGVALGITTAAALFMVIIISNSKKPHHSFLNMDRFDSFQYFGETCQIVRFLNGKSDTIIADYYCHDLGVMRAY